MTERVADREEPMRNLRDHRYPCEHLPAPADLPEDAPDGYHAVFKCDEYGCPGGRVMEFNLEAAAREMISLEPDEPWPGKREAPWGWDTGDSMALAGGDTKRLEAVLTAALGRADE